MPVARSHAEILGWNAKAIGLCKGAKDFASSFEGLNLRRMQSRGFRARERVLFHPGLANPRRWRSRYWW
jgi:hypothetical protein